MCVPVIHYVVENHIIKQIVSGQKGLGLVFQTRNNIFIPAGFSKIKVFLISMITFDTLS